MWTRDGTQAAFCEVKWDRHAAIALAFPASSTTNGTQIMGCPILSNHRKDNIVYRGRRA